MSAQTELSSHMVRKLKKQLTQQQRELFEFKKEVARKPHDILPQDAAKAFTLSEEIKITRASIEAEEV